MQGWQPRGGGSQSQAGRPGSYLEASEGGALGLGGAALSCWLSQNGQGGMGKGGRPRVKPPQAGLLPRRGPRAAHLQRERESPRPPRLPRGRDRGEPRGRACARSRRCYPGQKAPGASPRLWKTGRDRETHLAARPRRPARPPSSLAREWRAPAGRLKAAAIPGSFFTPPE